ncbi:MAG TPA: class II glutamine amidotransferase [Syntrophobacteria bacterium]|nr:class II glutamine amidotransferase [Syntrophobacteria bacterium]
MCDLFALSAATNYSAPEALPLFASRASKNMDGWGIGYFRKGRALVEKSAQRVYLPGRVHDSYQRLARVVSSRIIISHVRFRTSGLVDECHAHPFTLKFCGSDWLFAHNGRAPAIESYRTEGEASACAISDSARAFEFLRDRLASYCGTYAAPLPLFDHVCEATARLISEYPGEYNYLLSNGSAIFAFTNHRQFMLLKGSRQLKGCLLLTTLAEGLSDERWLRMARPSSAQGLMLALSGTDVVVQRSL